MGCDIHIEVFVRYEEDDIRLVQRPLEYTWRKTGLHPRYALDPCWPDGRDYAAFAILAGVRSTTGACLIEPRGLPDFWPEDSIWKVEKDLRFGVPERMLLDGGDHSQTWLTLAEIRRLPWSEYLYAPDSPQFLTTFVPMLESLERAGFSDNDIIVTMGFDS